MSDRLIVLLAGERCGILRRIRGGIAEFTYEENWDTFPLSLSMPIAGQTLRGETVSNYFWGLLSDNVDILKGWARNAQTSHNNLFGLLAEVGEDCAGAVQVLTAEKLKNINRRKSSKVKWIDTPEIAERLRELNKDQAAWRRKSDQGRLSLAGALPKTAYFKQGDRWGVPNGEIPTTHIFKPEMKGLDGQLIDEHICLQLARHLGLPAANSEIMQFEDQRAIVIERYDRYPKQNGEIERIHQEDMCQALGVHPDYKYQNPQGGKINGPSVEDIVKLLRSASSDPIRDVHTFIKAQLFNWLIGGTDAHAKNYSLIILPHGQIGLAPLYDINSTLPLLGLDRRAISLAMKVGKNYALHRITGRDWARLGNDCGVKFSTIENWMSTYREAILPALLQISEDVRKTGNDHPIINDMLDLLTTHLDACDKQFAQQ